MKAISLAVWLTASVTVLGQEIQPWDPSTQPTRENPSPQCVYEGELETECFDCIISRQCEAPSTPEVFEAEDDLERLFEDWRGRGNCPSVTSGDLGISGTFCHVFCEQDSSSCLGLHYEDNSETVGAWITPQGDEFSLGRCICDPIPLVDDIVDMVTEAMEIIDAALCPIINAGIGMLIDLAITAVTAIPLVGPGASAGARAAVQAARLTADLGGDVAAYNSYVGNCDVPSISGELFTLLDEAAHAAGIGTEIPDGFCTGRRRGRCRSGRDDFETSDPHGTDGRSDGPRGDGDRPQSQDNNDSPSTNAADSTASRTEDPSTSTQSASGSTSTGPTTTESPTSSSSDDASSTTSTSEEACSQSSTRGPNKRQSGCGDTRQYLILANRRANDRTLRDFNRRLEQTAGRSNSRAIEGREGSILFWTARLNSSQRRDLQRDSAVADISEDDRLDQGLDPVEMRPENSRVKRFSQPGADPELAVLSEPRGRQQIPTTFDYDDSAGRGLTMYIIDSGANTQHSQYTGMPGSKRWLYVGNPTAMSPQTETDEANHGACVLSKAASPLLGTAKNIDVVIVKLLGDSVVRNHSTASQLLEALVAVDQDIGQHPRYSGRAIVNLSLGRRTTRQPIYIDLMRHVIQSINDSGVPVVVAAGNHAETRSREVDTHPALFSIDMPGVITVGAVDNDGRIPSWAQRGRAVNVWAPGVNVRCALNTGQDGYQTASGSSLSAPAVAGIGLYLMGLPNHGLGMMSSIPGGLKSRLERLAHPRGGRVDRPERPIAYNGFHDNHGRRWLVEDTIDAKNSSMEHGRFFRA